MNRAVTYLDKSTIADVKMYDLAVGGSMTRFCLCAEEIFDELWNGSSKFDTVVFYNDDFDHEELYNTSKNHPKITFALNKLYFDEKFIDCPNIIYFDFILTLRRR